MSKMPPMPPMPSKLSEHGPPKEIPSGPSPDKKEFTAGWNDPPKTIEKSDAPNPMRMNRKSKAKAAAPAAPVIPMFNPTQPPN